MTAPIARRSICTQAGVEIALIADLRAEADGPLPRGRAPRGRRVETRRRDRSARAAVGA